MTNLQEVPTDELLSFQDFPSVHNSGSVSNFDGQVYINTASSQNDPGFSVPPTTQYPSREDMDHSTDTPLSKSFWTIEYYQQFFDVDTKDVMERILASVTPRRDNSLKYHLRQKPDLYGPFWISLTLIFTIAISGNISNYLQHANEQYHWKYDFHLVSYAATAIYIYVILVPLCLWGLLKWSSDVADLDGLEEGTTPGALELTCIYGYSLFIYIPVSIFWTIQINFLQWTLVLVAALLSGSVLLFTLMPALRLSRHKLLLTIATMSCHLLLAAGFMLFFFHVPNTVIVEHALISTVSSNLNLSHKL